MFTFSQSNNNAKILATWDGDAEIHEELASKGHLMCNSSPLEIKVKRQDVWIDFKNVKPLTSICWNISSLCDSIEQRNKKRSEEGVMWSSLRD